MSVNRLAFLWRNRQGFSLTAIVMASVGLLLVGVLTGDNPRAAAAEDTPRTADAFSLLTPGGGGNCAAPANGGTVMVGCRFVLDLMLNAGTNDANQPGGGTTAHQSYLTFTYSLLRVARVATIATSCTVTSTLTADYTVYDSVMQNETCNGPPETAANCVFRGVSVAAGSIAWTSGDLANCPMGCPDPNYGPPWDQYVFRVARMGLCATAPGQAVLHWQFAPPDPVLRDSQIVNLAGDLIQNRALYTDYVINIVAPSLASHLTWQGRPAQPHALQQMPVTLTLKLGATEINYPSQNTDANGNFSVDVAGLPAGTYNWRAKGPKFLASGGTVNLTGASMTNLEMGLTKVGDSNNDNVVNVGDFTIVRNAFGTASGDLSYDDYADLNGDQLVNVMDVNQNKINFGSSGAPPP